MKRKIAVVWVLLSLWVLLAAACGAPAEPMASEAPGETPAATETPQPTPQPTQAPPVTPKDIPAYFLPGLADPGAVPAGGYTIGIIAAGVADAQAWQTQADALAGAYQERFGVTVLAETAYDMQIERSKAREMLAQGVDFMIFDADSDGAIGTLCEENGVPYITMGGQTGKTPGENGYVCAIVHDDYLDGVLTGLSIVQALQDAYGEARGNVGEIVPAADDVSAQLRSMGIRRVFSEYENVNVVISILGGSSDESRYLAASNVLKAFRSGELDAVVTMDEQTALQTLQAVLDADRSEMIGRIWSMNAAKDGLTAVWYGQFAQTIENTRQTGLVALEYAVQYLEGNGDDIPPVVPAVSRVFDAGSQAQKDAIAAWIGDMDEAGTDTLFESAGVYAPFVPDLQAVQAVYPQHYFEYDDVQQFLAAFMPFTTGEPVYGAPENE